MISFVDLSVILTYLILLLAVGYYFMRKNTSEEDFYISGRTMSSGHIGLSVVATDVGGGFSIGLGGLGFIMGISGSWMLFTGLLGAWISGVWLIPKIYDLGLRNRFTTFPQVLSYFYDSKTARLAGIISLIGYLGFTSSQLLAGAKLASSVFTGLDLTTALWVMGTVTIVYTVMGGMTAVIYTDTIQWSVLIGGLLLLGLPIAWTSVGGWEVISKTVNLDLLSLQSISLTQLVNWAITIIPIWFIGMTLYQRIYACKSQQDAQKAWFIAGLFEWPIMAFLGVSLGLLARVYAENGQFAAFGFEDAAQLDPEIGMPLLLKAVIPRGLLGVLFSVYFSAILSTADSCLMAASGNFQTDVFGKALKKWGIRHNPIRVSQFITLSLGFLALFIAHFLENVLNMMLYSYAFMVSGLVVPLIAAVFFDNTNTKAAFISMITGGSITLVLQLSKVTLPLNLDPIFYGLVGSSSYILVHFLITTRNSQHIDT